MKEEGRGEADRLFTVFTKEFGKLDILGRAIRKINSKLRAGTELFCFSEIEFIQGKNYKTLTDVVPLNRFGGIKKSPLKLQTAAAIAEAVDIFIKGEEKDERIWELLLEVFQKIGENNARPEFQGDSRRKVGNLASPRFSLELLFYYFLWRLFLFLGYAPDFYHCALCGKKLLPETFFFSTVEGGIICWRCLKKRKEEVGISLGEGAVLLEEAANGADKKEEVICSISVETVKLLRLFLKENVETVGRLKISRANIKNLEEVSEIYSAHLQKYFLR